MILSQPDVFFHSLSATPFFGNGFPGEPVSGKILSSGLYSFLTGGCTAWGFPVLRPVVGDEGHPDLVLPRLLVMDRESYILSCHPERSNHDLT